MVDDDEAISWALQRGFKAEGWPVERVSSAELALKFLDAREIDLVVLDVRLPGMNGLDAMQLLRAKKPSLPIILMTAFGTLDVAVAAIRYEASEYLTKPFDLKDAIAAVRRAWTRQYRAASPEPSAIDKNGFDRSGLVGNSAPMQELFKQIALASQSDISVLLYGESGSGKELVARALHRHGTRSGKPFFAVNLSSLSPTLIESELFGHAKGAFTGSERDREGVLELANEATLFIDEAGDIPLNIQIKLLRVLEQREVVRVGEAHARKASFRVISATSVDPDVLLEEGRMRRDFFYRVAGFVIRVPPLRERAEDIPILADCFLRAVSADHPGFADATLAELKRRAFPGNVRELRQAVEYASLMSRGEVIHPVHLPSEQRLAQATTPELSRAIREWVARQFAQANDPADVYSKLIQEVDAHLVDEVLKRADSNRTRAAKILGLDRATLRKKGKLDNSEG